MKKVRNMSDTLAQAIYQKYIVPTERKPHKYLGVELEYPLVNLSRKPVNIPAVQEIVQDFVTEFAFTKQSRDDNGNLYSATEPVSGDNLSFDCSFNTIEFSFGKEESIAVLHKRFAAYYDYLQPRLREIGHLMTGMGIHPFYLYNENVPIANDRYRMLFHHLESYNAYESPLFHRFPNFGMFAAASQVQLDVQKNDIIKTLNTMNLLEPYNALLFANSFFERLPELTVSRDYLWRYSTQGYNPHNLGMYDTVFHNLDEYIEYVKGQSIYCVGKGNKYYHFKPTPLREYVQAKTISGQYFENGEWHRELFQPDIADIKDLRTFKFADLTYRGTIEYRSACEQPITDVFAHAAFHAGLAEEIDALAELLAQDHVLYQHGYTASELRELTTKRKLPLFANRNEISAQLMHILELAQSGLQKRGLHEENYLQPLFTRAERLSNPALDLLSGLERGDKIEKWIERYAKRSEILIA